MTHQEALEICKAEVQRRGFRVSQGSWSEESHVARACAFSVESCGPAFYGHPKCTVQARRDDATGDWVFLYENTRINLG